MSHTVLFPVSDAIPTGADREPVLEKFLDWADEAHDTPVPDVLSAFFGQPLDTRTLRITGLHHVALYIGDYRDEKDFEDWLETVSACPRVNHVTTGPSHIAPRAYGTPGHWINLRTALGNEVELFTCRRRDIWAERPAEQKTTLMSHFGLCVDTPGHVRALLDFLASFDGVRLLAYAPADELGHTYGHLVRDDTDRVLELVHAGVQPGGPA
ncbi:hypothetical protein ABZX69_13885 [Streptomyces sp. NPDC004074]|uniref:hypothetical protein n=1 Tax=unclassified Streptomyces TaxID=2593676 RepID=UPI0033BAAD66